MTKKEINKKTKNIKKIDKLITKNDKEINYIVVSELFLNQIIDVAQHVDIDLIEEDGDERLYLFGKPVQISQFINEGCILMLYNEEYVVLKGI